VIRTDREVSQADVALGARHGCQPPPQLPNRWVLGIDHLKELRDADSDGRLLAFLCSIAKDYEPYNNLSQFLLFGPRMFHTLHPENVKAVLSENFEGDLPYATYNSSQTALNLTAQITALGFEVQFLPHS
jgi:hypothetical protein